MHQADLLVTEGRRAHTPAATTKYTEFFFFPLPQRLPFRLARARSYCITNLQAVVNAKLYL